MRVVISAAGVEVPTGHSSLKDLQRFYEDNEVSKRLVMRKEKDRVILSSPHPSKTIPFVSGGGVQRLPCTPSPPKSNSKPPAPFFSPELVNPHGSPSSSSSSSFDGEMSFELPFRTPPSTVKKPLVRTPYEAERPGSPSVEQEFEEGEPLEIDENEPVTYPKLDLAGSDVYRRKVPSPARGKTTNLGSIKQSPSSTNNSLRLFFELSVVFAFLGVIAYLFVFSSSSSSGSSDQPTAAVLPFCSHRKASEASSGLCKPCPAHAECLHISNTFNCIAGFVVSPDGNRCVLVTDEEDSKIADAFLNEQLLPLMRSRWGEFMCSTQGISRDVSSSEIKRILIKHLVAINKLITSDPQPVTKQKSEQVYNVLEQQLIEHPNINNFLVHVNGERMFYTTLPPVLPLFCRAKLEIFARDNKVLILLSISTLLVIIPYIFFRLWFTFRVASVTRNVKSRLLRKRSDDSPFIPIDHLRDALLTDSFFSLSIWEQVCPLFRFGPLISTDLLLLLCATKGPVQDQGRQSLQLGTGRDRWILQERLALHRCRMNDEVKKKKKVRHHPSPFCSSLWSPSHHANFSKDHHRKELFVRSSSPRSKNEAQPTEQNKKNTIFIHLEPFLSFSLWPHNTSATTKQNGRRL